MAPLGFIGIVMHTGDEVASFGNGMFAVPMASLFEE